MTNTSIRWGLAILAGLLAQIVMIIVSIVCVAIYSYAIHTGESPDFYRAFAMTSGPWVSFIAGGPVFFGIARWIRRRTPSAALGTAMAMAGVYLAIEVIVLILWPTNPAATLPLIIGGYLLKLAGAWLGAGGTATHVSAKAT